VLGRGFRFLLEGYFAIRYGAQAKLFLAKYYPWIGFGLATIIAVLLTRSLWRRRSDSRVQASLEARN
jgi:predicted ATP-grasp superfamily ATP-dependent carboligase